MRTNSNPAALYNQHSLSGRILRTHLNQLSFVACWMHPPKAGTPSLARTTGAHSNGSFLTRGGQSSPGKVLPDAPVDC